MKKTLGIVAVILVLAVIIYLNLRRARGDATEVDLVEVGRKDLAAEVSGSGRIEARNSVSITSNVVGKVLEVAVEEGDFVETGDLILRIDPGERKALLEQAEASRARAAAEVELAAAELRQAEVELTRVRGLVEGGLASEQNLEGALTSRDVRSARLAAAKEDVRNARARVEHAERELEKTVVRAEIPGVIVRLSVEEGENVLAGDLYNSGSAIVVIADLSEMEAQVLVDETEVVSVEKGQRAEVTVDAFPDTTLVGRVIEVGNSAYNAGPLGSQEAKDFRVRILLDEAPPRFRPGLSARGEIVTDVRDSALAIPIEALTLRDPEREERLAAEGKKGGRRRRVLERESSEDSEEVEGVFVVDDDVARFRPVKTGIAGEKDFEVVEGLAEGEKVVRGPFDAIRDLASGDKVKSRKKKTPSDRDRDRDRDREGEEDADGGESPGEDS
jgi:HlyD family secretion protein